MRDVIEVNIIHPKRFLLKVVDYDGKVRNKIYESETCDIPKMVKHLTFH